MTKLTLSANEKVVARAKQLAVRNHTSVSAMFDRFVKAIAPPRDAAPPVGPITRKATGLIKMPRSKSDRALLEEALAEKHQRR
jgi:hypothetical protein